jgi:N-acetylneuraminate synthase/sialic acid synthase
MIKYIAETGKPLIVITGGCEMPEVQHIYDEVMPINSQLPLLQCTCIYPAPPEVQNLRVVGTYREAFPDVVTGLSTHNPNWWVNLAAYALGGRIFENHFTTDRTLKGTDQAFSVTPDMLREYRSAIDEVAVAWG